MHFNPHTIPSIICMILALACGGFVLSRNCRAKLNQIFFFICLDIAAWMSFTIPMNFAASDQLLTLWFKVSFCFISFLPIMLFTFATTYLNSPKNHFWFLVNSLIGATFCILSLSTNLIIQGVNDLGPLQHPQAGILHPFLILHCSYLVFFGLKLMFEFIRNPNMSARSVLHVKSMFYGLIIMGISMWDFLGNYGVKIYPIGPFCCTVFLWVVTTAIVKHQLMDIEIALKRSFVYTCLVSAMTAVYLVAVVVFENVFSNYVKLQAFSGSLFSAIVTAIIFVPLRNWLQQAVDQLFFRSTPIAIAEENEQLRQEIIQTEKFKAIANLASGLAHEIKNPLTTIQTFHDYLPRKKDDAAFMEQYQSIIGKETQRIQSILQELLAFARPIPPQTIDISVEKLLMELSLLIEPACAKRNISIQKIFDGPEYIKADPNQIKQALLNLLLNAVDAMPGGGILSIHGAVEGTYYIISISDNGCGIAKEDLRHIFEPFYTKKEKGTGLGLSITQAIIEAHKGSITVSSVQGKGTSFQIRLPYAL